MSARRFVVGQRVRVKGMASLVGVVANSAECPNLTPLYLVRLDLQGDLDLDRSVPYFEDELEEKPKEDSR